MRVEQEDYHTIHVYLHTLLITKPEVDGVYVAKCI